ncbi:TPA: hypothetical protein DDW35_06540 [Candidatus Sumerlaeota bacterium]|jgi:hypothetical protein|nr:hypothetical protein [Candidatus Sumerlaeota bacterium]
MTDNTNNPLLTELVTFIQHQIPGLEDGEYQLTVSQNVNDSSGAPISDDSLTNTYTFAVLGDRFSFSNPQSTLYSIFPANNASGEFNTVLPHVVLQKATYPWSRYPTSQEPFSPPAPGSDTDADVPTWLAILSFDDDDVTSYPGLTLEPAAATVGDLFPLAANPNSSLGSNYSYFQGATNTKGLEPGSALTDSINVIDVPLELFWQVAPTIDDLKFSAHVRQVSLKDKATMPGVSDVGEPLGTFSIIVGNRLPQQDKKTYAYLVSLEELQPFLPTNEQGGAPNSNTLNSSKCIRLAVLTSWTFYSIGSPAAFVDQLLALNGRDPNGSTDALNTNLRLNYTGSNNQVINALSMGYVPLNHQLRTAGKTVSWYRGPLVNYSITQPGISFPISSPDQATQFDPTTGMLDVSYATAWALGRQLSLQDSSFSTALYNWKCGLSQAAVDAVENELLQEQFSSVLNAPQAPALEKMTSTQTASPARTLLHQTIQALMQAQKTKE